MPIQDDETVLCENNERQTKGSLNINLFYTNKEKSLKNHIIILT